MSRSHKRSVGESMTMGRMPRWLLVAMFLAGCAGPVERRGTATSVEAPSETVAATATATGQTQPTATPTASPSTVTTGPPSATPTTIMPSAMPGGAPDATPGQTPSSSGPHPLQIEVMREQSYPGSPIAMEQTLTPGTNYERYVVSYLSDGYKIYALMTVPHGTRPATGWPAIVFNHGYIPPSAYRTTERYEAYVDAIARNGYIVFKTDLRGHGRSEGGDSVGDIVYGTPAYTVDVLNAAASLQTYEDADPNRIGMWGHSMGGQLILRAMVVSQDIKAGVIWAGDVAPYPDVVAAYWGWDNAFIERYGTAEENPAFWRSVSPNAYLADLSGPLQLHHGTSDADVSVAWSEALLEDCQASDGPSCELYTYPGDNHNISAHFGVAMERTVAFFDDHVKGE